MSTSNQRSRPPISGLRRPSATAGQFEPLYTTSYITPPHVRRSASDTFLFERSREERQRRAREDERARLIQEAQQAEEAKETLSRFMILCLTICMAGVQFTWTVELAYGTPYLLSFNLSKDTTALVWLAGPLSGLIIQPVIGAFSDRCTSRLGRRRPFILAGGFFVCLSMLFVAYAREIAGWLINLSGNVHTPEYLREMERRVGAIIAIVSFYMLDFSLNAVQASCRALILDIPPLWQQQRANASAARLSNVAMVVGYFTGFVDLVKFFPYFGDTQIKVFCLVAVAVFVATVVITCVTTREQVNTDTDNPSPWYSAFSYIWHALRSLPDPIQRLCNVQFFAWLGWFPFLFYSTTWVSDLYFATHPRTSPDSWAKGTRAGSFALLMYAIVSVISGIVLPWLVTHKPRGMSFFSMKNIYTASNLLFAICMLSTLMVSNVATATLVVALVGIPWSVVLWIPFALVGEYMLVSSETLAIENDEVGSNEAVRSGCGCEETEATALADDSQSSPSYGATSSKTGSRDGESSRSKAVGLPAYSEQPEEDEMDAGMVLGVHNMYIVFPQFAVAIISSFIFRIVSWAEKLDDQDKEGSANVAWVLLFGGIMSMIATVLSRRISEVPRSAMNRDLTKSPTVLVDPCDRISI